MKLEKYIAALTQIDYALREVIGALKAEAIKKILSRQSTSKVKRSKPKEKV